MRRMYSTLFVISLFSIAGVASALDPPIAVAKKAKQKANEHGAGPDAKKEVSNEGFTFGPDKKTRYEIDSDSERNQITFTSKAPAETFKGTASHIKGFLEINPRKVNAAEGEFVVEWKDVSLPKKMMDQHMKADPWVNTASHPKIVFKVSGIEESHLQQKNKKLSTFKTKLMGEWEMNGKKQEMTIPVTLSYVEAKKEKPDVKEVLGIKTKFKIKLEDFDIKGNGAIGSKVAPEQSIDLNLVLARTDKPEPSEEEPAASKPKPQPKPKKKPIQGI
jgi:polyisoprenoid-binding protein YceI